MVKINAQGLQGNLKNKSISGVVFNNLNLDLRQASLVQPMGCKGTPAQLKPPFTGKGLLHDLTLVLTPVPHVTLQSSYGPQLLHFPFTGANI